MDANEARARLLIPNGDWSPSTLAVWLRARGFCEYCGKDLQRHSDDYFHGYNIDHVVPACKEGNSDVENYALACRACNLIKRNFDPRNGESNVPREELILRARSHIEHARKLNDERMRKALPLLRCCGLDPS